MILTLIRYWTAIKLFQAEIQHDGAVKIIHEAREEYERAIAMAKHTRKGLLAAQEDMARCHERAFRLGIKRRLGA